MRKIGDLWSFNTRDLMRGANCRHCTTISVLHAIEDPIVESFLADELRDLALLKERGEDVSLPQKFGIAFEETLTEELVDGLPSGTVQSPETPGSFEQTISLMRKGVPIIYQGALEQRNAFSRFSGLPDFLLKKGWRLSFKDTRLTAERIGDDSENLYTVWDAKYSTHAKPDYALQVAIYIEALADLNLLAPDSEHGLILGDRSVFTLLASEIVPATRLARMQLEKSIRDVLSSDRESLLAGFTWHCADSKQCEVCEYPNLCKSEREKSGDLLLVAGLGSAARLKLINAGIKTVIQLADSTDTKIKGMSAKSLEKFRLQARLQLKSEASKKPEYEPLQDPLFAYLPKPDDSDVFFDMEGFPYFPNGGLEYLFGNWTREGKFVDFWALSRSEEKSAVIEFMLWVYQRMKDNPSAHIYHYASYERTALKRLATRHGVMARELAELEAEHRFVDLYPMVTNSLRVGEQKYSIKNLERHYRFERKSDVKKADKSMDEFADMLVLAAQISLAGDASHSLEQKEKFAAKREALRLYNTEDVQSTMHLYDWLRSFPEACSRNWRELFYEVSEAGDGELSKSEIELRELENRTASFFEPLAGYEKGLDPETDNRVAAWEALAHSILFYKREDVMYWADMNVRMGLDDEDLAQDREALLTRSAVALGVDEIHRPRLQRIDLVAKYQTELPSESLFVPKVDMKIVIRFEVAPGVAKRNFGKITAVGPGVIEFSREVQDASDLDYPPTAIFENTRYNTSGKQKHLIETAEHIRDKWGSPFNEPPSGFAILDLLLRTPPTLHGLPKLANPDPENYLPTLIESVEAMSNSTLAIQGPPGSGKTYLASHLISHLVEHGKRVMVSANSHAATHNLLKDCIGAGVDSNLIFKTAQEGASDEEFPWNSFEKTDAFARAINKVAGGFVAAGTSFTLSNSGVRETHFDYLIIDEAAQFSLVDLIAGSGIADNIILFGDPQQLPQVVQAIHPGGVENSALGHLMGEHDILPSELGYFVEITRRLHPNVNAPVSWLSYQGKLRAHEMTTSNVIQTAEPGVHPIAMNHAGNSTHSPEEVEKVVELVSNHIPEVGASEILIVAPYNNQVNAIRRALDEHGFEEVRVGTVDKFQGQEGLVVVVSLAASSAQDAPRGLGFLLDRNRLNVAISRAKSVCYLVHSSNLLNGHYKTLEDVKAVSGLAGVLEQSLRMREDANR